VRYAVYIGITYAEATGVVWQAADMDEIIRRAGNLTATLFGVECLDVVW